MLTLEFFDAKHGDAFLTRWGDGGDRAMLVDGGPTGLWEGSLRAALLPRLPRSGVGAPTLDAVMLSHVDDDHAAGLVRLLAEIRRARRDHKPDPISVRRLWFNAVEELVDRVDPDLSASVQPLLDDAHHDEAVAASYNQGREIRDAAEVLGLQGNQPFEAPLVCGAVTDLAGLAVTVVAPDQAALDALATKWRQAKKAKDPGVLAASYTDRSIPNLSSIVVHVEHGGRTALLTGDARGDRLLTGLEQSGLVAKGGGLHVDVFKLPHHGSINNMEPDLFERVTADHYVISADGVRHHHPNEETLEALVGARGSADKYTIHLTNEIPFAATKLADLQDGRAFATRTRAAAEPVIRVELS
ncbi:Metal-dependent hydrolase, beta-lactamase superfamily II [Pedococcus dokdonensis]|uniref:Metal-dependent hydrolase, beta-lactamase superfamily II n=1 Tax=Pedococcus dokdonensis TaxID=443156 RepID=A0A1H0RZ03_9MICO|nr:Metal-dependent hydrolase, beta-lactamase superfamily II [Pedococcus dokdonensis]